MDKFGRRPEDSGHENPIVTLARIDENIKFLKLGAIEVKQRLDSHESDDEMKFDSLGKKIWEHARYIYIGIGIAITIEVIMGIHK